MATNLRDPLLGYDFNAVTQQCFVAMLNSPDWFNRAVQSGGGTDPTAIIQQIVKFAGIASVQLETYFKSTNSI